MVRDCPGRYFNWHRSGCDKPRYLRAQIVATYQLAGAGPMVFDGTNLWVANGPNVTAIDPANGDVIVSQNLGAQWNVVGLAYDIPGGKLWASSGRGLTKASAEEIISSNGNAAIVTKAVAATAISLDVSEPADVVCGRRNGTFDGVRHADATNGLRCGLVGW